MSGPLNGIKVLDLTRVLAGPWATQLLADFGADVIKIEDPRGGDETRHWGPPFLEPRQEGASAQSAYFLSANRGKRSVALNIATADGQRIVRALAARSDVLVENFRVGTLARRGLAWADLHAVNPRLVYCSVSAFGQDGPRRDEPGYDAMIQASGGLMSITGNAEGEAGAGPQKVGVAVADLMAGMYATSGILAALHHRERTGAGQHIDIALYDTQLAWLANQALNYLVGGVAPRRQGTGHPNIVPYQAFATADGYLMLAVGNDRQFASFVQAAGAPELAADPCFASNAQRVLHRASLVPVLERLMREATTQEWIQRLRACGVPCGPINDIGQALADPQAVHRGTRIEMQHAAFGSVPGVRNPLRFSDSPLAFERAPPLLGAHTESVLRDELGMRGEEIEALRARGVIGTGIGSATGNLP
jgi:crotonobetainyl-CoA:carnitine CoA-transferase CaiB-like acyl-CoA transferase